MQLRLLAALLASALSIAALAAPAPDDLPAPLPAPLPPPPVTDDPLELLWGHRVQFDAEGEPLVAIRLAHGASEVRFHPLAPARLVARSGEELRVAAGTLLRARAVDALPAALSWHVLLGEHALSDREGLTAARARWEARGIAPVLRNVGGVYGITGKVVDNRRVQLLAPADGEEPARALAERLRVVHGVRPEVVTEVLRRPSGRVEVLDAEGRTLLDADRVVALAVDGEAGFELAPGGRRVAYRGRLHLTIDAGGRLAAVDAIGLEPLLRGIVPSEIPASSPREALRAQAVTARSNVLAQIGTRHLTDPWSLCDEVHCQMYRGIAAEAAPTDAAVRATAGEALLDARGALVDGVYSAVCGGHGEDNDAVWPDPPSASLRGGPDLPRGGAPWARALGDERRLRAFLRDAPPSWCAAGPRRRWRWERRFSREELGALVAPLGVGRFRDLRVLRRGVSGRALAVEVRGDAGRAVITGELRIRRAFGGLNSAMFVVEREAGGGLHLRGGGWGHGAGMCQWGAVGRARAGQGYREILRAYFAGAEVARIY